MGAGRWASSVFPLHWLLEAKLTSGRDDGQAALKVVVDEVTDAVKDPVLRPNLRGRSEGEVEWVPKPGKTEHFVVELPGTSDLAQEGKGRSGLPGPEASP